MDSLGETFKRWTCPSDRELTLRAKLRAGWSSRISNNGDCNDETQISINESEQAAIVRVLDRANMLQEQENERNRILSERLERLRRQAQKRDLSGFQAAQSQSWIKNCILCNEEPSFFRKFYTCKDCKNPVCKKCSVDNVELDGRRLLWLCKICFESRELLKRTNKWTELTERPL